MQIGIIGTGNMGRSIGLVLARLGHHVFFGARDLRKAQAAASMAEKTRSGSNDEAAQFGDIIFYTLRGISPSEVLQDISLLDGKTVVDLNNQEVPADFHFPPVTTSLAETLAGQIPKAHVVKAFNTIPMEVFEHCPNDIKKFNVAIFVAANNRDAKSNVLSLASEMGFRAIDCGDLYQARLLESSADLLRLLIIQGKMADATISITDVPDAATTTLGGRQASALK